MGGSDRKGFTYGAWSCFMLDTRNLPTLFAQDGGGAPNLQAITRVGIGFNHLGKAVAGALTVHADVGRYGTGLIITGGTISDPGTFKDISDFDASTQTAYGIIREPIKGLFSVQGSLTFGDETGTSSTYFKDQNTLLVFEDNGAGNDAYSLRVVGNSTGTNTFILGEQLGEGDDALGINGVIIQSAGPHVSLDFQGTNVNTLNIYGSIFSGLGPKDISLGLDPSHNFIGNTVTNSGRVIGNRAFLRANTFTATDGSAALLWNSLIDIKKCSFIANARGIQHDTFIGSPFVYDELTFNANTYDIINTSDVSIVVNAINGANPTSYDPAKGFVQINNPTNFMVTNLVPDTEVRLFRSSDRFQLAGIESSDTTFSYQYNYTGDIEVYLVVHKQTYEYIKLTGLVLTENDQTIRVEQRFDRNYIPPS